MRKVSNGLFPYDGARIGVNLDDLIGGEIGGIEIIAVIGDHLMVGTESDGVCLPEFLTGLDVDGQDVANVTPGSIQRPAVRRDIRVF